MDVWVLSPTDNDKAYARWDKGVVLEGPIFCPANSGHQRDGKRLSDLTVCLQSPKLSDFVWTWYSECLIQQHVLALFQRHKLTGYEVRNVQVKITTAEKPLSLYEIVVTGWAGVAPPSSGIRLIEDCSACGLKIYSGFEKPSLLIDESRWDGSDFFTVWPLPKIIFVSNKAAQVIRDNQLAGSILKRPSELKSSLLNEISPGRLSYWMPEERAHELGDPLGIY